MAEESAGTVSRSIAERRADIAKARGRVSLALDELEHRARQPFESIRDAGRALPTSSGFVDLMAATSGLIARFRRLAPLFANHRVLTVGLAVAAGLAATARVATHTLPRPTCPNCGEVLALLDGAEGRSAALRPFRCLHCGWLGDMEDAAADRLRFAAQEQAG